MTRRNVLVAVFLVWAGVLFLLNLATHRKLQARIDQLQKDKQSLQQSVDRMLLTQNQHILESKKLAEALNQANLKLKNEKAGLNVVQPGHALSNAGLVTLKKAFDDIEGEVAAGKLKQLALMSAYDQMKKILDGPEVGKLQSEVETPQTK
jgi:hypothetical protein